MILTANGKLRLVLFLLLSSLMVQGRLRNCPKVRKIEPNKCASETSGIDSYQCGPKNCVYKSACRAEAAGFDLTTSCSTFTGIGVGYNNNTNVQQKYPILVCPPSNQTLAYCTKEYNPYQCGPGKEIELKQCHYANLCLARAAGFQSEDCIPTLKE